MVRFEAEPSNETVLDYVNLFSDRVVESYIEEDQDKLSPYCNFIFSLIAYADETNLWPTPFWIYLSSAESINALHDEKLRESADRHQVRTEVLGGRFPSTYSPREWRGMARVLSTRIYYPSGENVRGAFSSESILKALSSGSMTFRLG